MFLGNLSNVSEQKARKNQTTNNTNVFKALTISSIFDMIDQNLKFGNTSAGSLSGAAAGGGGEVVQDIRRKSKDEKVPIVYTSDNAPSKELTQNYFETVARTLLTETSVKEIVSDHLKNGVPLHLAAMEFQRDILEYNFGIERDFGCQFLSKISTSFPDDTYLFDCSQNFIYSALKSYVLQIRARANSHFIKEKLKTSGGISRPQILEFFEGCNAIMSLQETKTYLRDIHQSKKDILPIIVELQRNILTLLGFDATYACSELDKLGQSYGHDNELMNKMQSFAMCAQTSAKEAMMSEEERKVWLAEVPKEMKHFPYMYVIYQQQQEVLNRQKMKQAQQMPPAMAILQTVEGREKFGRLMAKISDSKDEIDKLNLPSWTEEQRSEYYLQFQSKPFIETLHSTGVNAPARINAFVDLSEEDIVSVMTMQTLMILDQKAGGTIAKSILEAQAKMWQAAAEAMKGGDPERAAGVAHAEGGKSIEGKIGSVLATLGSITNFGRQMQQAPPAYSQHMHAHGGGGGGQHVHGPECQHYHSSASAAPDVSSGKADKMDR